MTVADPGPAADRIEFEQATAWLRPGLIAHCYRMLGSLSDAEDQVQELHCPCLRSWET